MLWHEIIYNHLLHCGKQLSTKYCLNVAVWFLKLTTVKYFLYKQVDQRVFLIIINVFFSSLCFIWIPICHGSTVVRNILIISVRGSTVSVRQNLTSTVVRFWGIKTVPVLSGHWSDAGLMTCRVLGGIVSHGCQASTSLRVQMDALMAVLYKQADHYKASFTL